LPVGQVAAALGPDEHVPFESQVRHGPPPVGSGCAGKSRAGNSPPGGVVFNAGRRRGPVTPGPPGARLARRGPRPPGLPSRRLIGGARPPWGRPSASGGPLPSPGGTGHGVRGGPLWWAFSSWLIPPVGAPRRRASAGGGPPPSHLR